MKKTFDNEKEQMEDYQKKMAVSSKHCLNETESGNLFDRKEI